jgi:hypothetical protein
VSDLDDDLLEAAEPDPLYGLGEHINRKRGRYHFPPPPGTPDPKGNGYMRMTNLASAFSDQERLQLWLEWHTLMGLRLRDGLLFDEWMAMPLEQMDTDEQRKITKEFAERVRDTNGANDGGRRGTAQHAVNETYLNTGEMIGTRTQKQRLESALEALDRCGFDVLPGSQEQRVWHPLAGGTIGTRDLRVLCRRTGQVGSADWKTQLRFWTYQEVAGQMYGYDSAPWWWVGPPDERGRWVRAEPSTLTGHPDGPFAGKPVAIVVHMPRDSTQAVIKEVDLTYGRSVLTVAAQNTELRSIGRSVAVNRCPANDRPAWVDTPAIAE